MTPEDRKIIEENIYKDFPKEGVDFIDIFPLMQQNFPYDFLRKDFDIKPIVFIPEARGFLFYQSFKPHQVIPLRKSGKLPGDLVKISYKKEYGEDQLFFSMKHLKDAVNKMIFTTNVVPVTVFDDVLATGGTAEAIIKALNEVVLKTRNGLVRLKVFNFLSYLEITKLNGRSILEKLDVKVDTVYEF